MRMTHVSWWANKDGTRVRILAADDVFEAVKQVYKDAGYVISATEDWWETDGRGAE